MLTSGHLFCGAGGDTEGAISAGYKPLWGIENDKYAASVYRYRFTKEGTRTVEADISELSEKFIKSLAVPDIIIGGSPCQNFSLGGRREGLEGNQSSLFFEYLRFLHIVQPKMFVFENVSHLLAINDGGDFKQIIESFASVGYVGNWQQRDAIRHVPQNRKRLFCVGIHRRYTNYGGEILQAIACTSVINK
jgi:DNA (cytosine-5)-methyltransferase 1